MASNNKRDRDYSLQNWGNSHNASTGTATTSTTAQDNKAPRPPPAKRSRRTPLQEAKVIESVTETNTTTETTAAAVDDGVLQRIKKCIEKANHPNTNEAEAKAALFLSTKLMSQNNIDMMDVLQADGQEDQLQQHAGKSVVAIRSAREEGRSVKNEGFVGTLVHAMKVFFDCKAFSTRRLWSIDWTFYGIAQNTTAAALAFEMVYNRIAEWACDHKGGTTAYSYCVGVADGLYSIAKNEKRAEKERAKMEEDQAFKADEERARLQRQQEQERLDLSGQWGSTTTTLEHGAEEGDQPGDAYLGQGEFADDASEDDHESGFGEPGKLGFGLDNLGHMDLGLDFSNEDVKVDFSQADGDLINILGDLDEEIQKLVKPEPSDDDQQNSGIAPHIPDEEVKTEPTTNDTDMPVSVWSSEMQLVQFRETANKVADEFLQRENIKLHRRSSRTTAARDRDAFRQGRKDSKKIDVRQRRLE